MRKEKNEISSYLIFLALLKMCCYFSNTLTIHSKSQLLNTAEQGQADYLFMQHL